MKRTQKDYEELARRAEAGDFPTRDLTPEEAKWVERWKSSFPVVQHNKECEQCRKAALGRFSSLTTREIYNRKCAKGQEIWLAFDALQPVEERIANRDPTWGDPDRFDLEFFLSKYRK